MKIAKLILLIRFKTRKKNWTRFNLRKKTLLHYHRQDCNYPNPFLCFSFSISFSLREFYFSSVTFSIVSFLFSLYLWPLSPSVLIAYPNRLSYFRPTLVFFEYEETNFFHRSPQCREIECNSAAEFWLQERWCSSRTDSPQELWARTPGLQKTRRNNLIRYTPLPRESPKVTYNWR